MRKAHSIEFPSSVRASSFFSFLSLAIADWNSSLLLLPYAMICLLIFNPTLLSHLSPPPCISSLIKTVFLSACLNYFCVYQHLSTSTVWFKSWLLLDEGDPLISCHLVFPAGKLPGNPSKIYIRIIIIIIIPCLLVAFSPLLLLLFCPASPNSFLATNFPLVCKF